MHDVSKAINILDPNKDAIDKAICGTGKWHTDGTTETADKCASGKGNPSSGSYNKLSDMFKESDNTYNNYTASKNANMGNETSKTISKDVSALGREQKGVVSSAFAKAHEGAEIVAKWNCPTRY